MFGLFKNKTSSVDEEFKSWCLEVLQQQFFEASNYLAGKGNELNISADPFIGGYITGLVDGCFQRANDGDNREAVLATTKSVFVEVYQETGGETFFQMVVDGIVKEDSDYVTPYQCAISDHNKHKDMKMSVFPFTLKNHLIDKAMDSIR